MFTVDTLVKPLPPTMAYNVSRNLSFFSRIFTQFFGETFSQSVFFFHVIDRRTSDQHLVFYWCADPEGIANAQKSLGLGQEDKARRVS